MCLQEHGTDEPPCNCSNRVSIEYLSEGRYRLGDKTLFIRVSLVNARTHTHCAAAEQRWPTNGRDSGSQQILLRRNLGLDTTVSVMVSHSEEEERIQINSGVVAKIRQVEEILRHWRCYSSGSGGNRSESRPRRSTARLRLCWRDL